jgi:hypothetical protein
VKVLAAVVRCDVAGDEPATKRDGRWLMELGASVFQGRACLRDCTGRTRRPIGSSLATKVGSGGSVLAGRRWITTVEFQARRRRDWSEEAGSYDKK